MLLYALTIFLSSFLLFQVQPIIAKVILPWFGGSSAVWSTCMLFFQAMLLGGYAYAHFLHERLGARKQAIVHTVLLAGSLLLLPILPSAAWKPAGADNPSFRILLLLSATIGLPYFMLSSTSPLMQAWYARSNRGGFPYRLFALSNLASMLALLSYPPLIEPMLTTRLQAFIWSGAYGCFALVCSVVAWRSARATAGAVADPDPLPPATEGDVASAEPPAPPVAPTWAVRGLWMGLAACASAMLLAVTNYLTQDIAAIPFLWVLPLVVYLLSFILCFESTELYWRIVWLPLVAAGLGGLAYQIWPNGEELTTKSAILVSVGSLFACCMGCHGELARRKPHPRYLTSFYVMISLGGAIGGLFVGLIAPNLFNAYYEYPITLALCALLIVIVLFLDYDQKLSTGWWRVAGAAMVLALAGYLYCLGYTMRDMVHGYRVVARNFYGQLRVEDEGKPGDVKSTRKLYHGVIDHGYQSLYPETRLHPTSYYCGSSGVGVGIHAILNGPPRNFGLIGLGTGTLPVYGRPGDKFRIYEINPLVLELAKTEFTFLREAKAEVNVVLGDGRLALERDTGEMFDLFAVDAFSGDSIPIHLVTVEAFADYFQHLKPGGILAVHISNKYLDLKPVVAEAAAHFKKTALVFEDDVDEDEFLCYSSTWVLVLDPDSRTKMPDLFHQGAELKPTPGFRLWTDDFTNVYGLLK